MIAVDILGIEEIRKTVAAMPEVGNKALAFAINKAAAFGAAESSRRVRAQLNLSQKYIGATTSTKGRIHQSEKASAGKHRAVISTINAPTSLARFSVGTPTFGKQKKDPKVLVKKGGSSRIIKGGFFVKLNRGKDTDAGFNVGLAVRLGEGQRLNKNKLPGKPFRPGVYLLYAPDVPQAMLGISEEVLKPIGDVAENEFFRQFARLTK